MTLSDRDATELDRRQNDAIVLGPAAASLGSELMRLRLERGLSLRGLARQLGMSAHSGLVDYERGLRIPPPDLARAYERALCPGDDRLTRLRDAAMAERARRRMAASRPPEEPPQIQPEPRRPAFPVSAARSVEGLADLLDRLAGQLRRFTDGRG